MFQKIINVAGDLRDGDKSLRTAYWMGAVDGVITTLIALAITYAVAAYD